MKVSQIVDFVNISNFCSLGTLYIITKKKKKKKKKKKRGILLYYFVDSKQLVYFKFSSTNMIFCEFEHHVQQHLLFYVFVLHWMQILLIIFVIYHLLFHLVILVQEVE